MRLVLGGVVLGMIGWGLPAWADCAGEIAAVEEQLATTKGTPVDQRQDPAKSPEEVVDQMVEEGVSVEEQGEDTKYASGGVAEPRESWTGGESADHPAVAHLISAKHKLGEGDAQGCSDAVARARGALSEEE